MKGVLALVLSALSACGGHTPSTGEDSQTAGKTGASTDAGRAGGGAGGNASGAGAPSVAGGGEGPRGGSSGSGAGGDTQVTAGAGGNVVVTPRECETSADCDRLGEKDLCAGRWSCEEGTCVLDPSTAVDCSDVPAEECHDVQCDSRTGKCEQVPATDSRSCGSGFCGSGRCGFGSGVCEPTPRCGGCTVCDEASGECVAQSGYCSVDGRCAVAGALKEPDGCALCDVTRPAVWSPAPAGQRCERKDDCYESFACDGTSTVCAGAVPAKPTAAPSLRRPISGTRTGSPWAKNRPDILRPTFVWAAGSHDPACLPVTYHLQVDDSCVQPQACDFPSPEVDVEGLSAPTFQPSEALPIDVVAPVGRRYYWRVRACRRQSCSPWSWVSYVDVGRAPHDYNGDGYTDIAVGSYLTERAALIYGSPDGVAEATTVATDRHVTQGSTGDVNGDGFSDLVLFSSDEQAELWGHLNAYFGSAAGLPSKPSWELARRTGEIDHLFVGADYEADGYADLIVRRRSLEFLADYFRGSSRGLPSARSAYFENPLVASTHAMHRMLSGDFNGDAVPDLMFNAGSIQSTLVYLSAFGLPAQPSDVITNLSKATDHGMHTVVGDANGDYLDDVAIAMTRSRNQKVGALYTFESRGKGFPDTPDLTLPDLTHPDTNNYGTDATGGRLVGGDRLFDIVVSAPRTEPSPTLYVYGAFALASTVPIELRIPDGSNRYWFGSPMSVPGDLNGDGHDDLVACDQEHGSLGRAVIYYGPLDTLPSPRADIVETFCDYLH